MEARVAVLLGVLVLAAGCLSLDGEAEEEPLEETDREEAPSEEEPSPAEGDTSTSPDANVSEDGASASTNDTPEDAVAASENTTRETLEEQRIAVEQDAAGWSTTRLVVTPDLWRGDWGEDGGSVEVQVVTEKELDTAEELVIGLGVRRAPVFDGGEPRTSFNLYTFGEDAGSPSYGYSLSCSGEGCSDKPPRLTFAFLVGTMEGSGSLSSGLLGEGESFGDAEVADRSRLDWPVEHEGEQVQGGTHAVVRMDGGPLFEDIDLQWDAGHIEVERGGPAPRPSGVNVAAEHRMSVEAELPAGTTNALFLALDAVEASAWTADWALPSTSGSETGVYVKPGPVGQGLAPAWGAYQEHGAGEASFSMEKTLVGKEDPWLAAGQGLPLSPQLTVGSWGFFDATLEELYGWEMDEYATSSSPVPSPTAASDATERAEVCLAPDVPCLVQVDHAFQDPAAEATAATSQVDLP